MLTATRVGRGTVLVLGTLGLPALVVGQGPATHSSNVWSATLARDDSSVATVALGEVRIWSLPSGSMACRLDGNFYGAYIETSGDRGYHVTFINREQRPTRAIVVDGHDCSQRSAEATMERGRHSVGTRLVVRRANDGWTVQTPTGTTVSSNSRPTTLDVGDTWYACTMTEKNKIVYFRLTGAERPEKIGETDPNGFKSCGPLALSADSTMLLNAGAGSAIDLRRKRVLVSSGASEPTSVGIDAARRQLIVGHGSGVDFVDVKSGERTWSRGGVNMFGYTSVSATWYAIRSAGTARPLVELTSPQHRGVVLDDQRSRQGADILVAREEAEVRARNDSVRRVREAEAAENARIRASNEALFQQHRQLVEGRHGRIAVSARLRQVQYQGAYEFIPISVSVGDLLVLVSDRDGTIGYSISDGTQILRGERTAENATSGFAVTRSTITGNVSGNLIVQGRGAPVYVFLIRKADVK